MTVAEFVAALATLPAEEARSVLLEAVLPDRLVACGEPGFDDNATLWSLSAPDHAARLGFAVRATILDPEYVFPPEETALVREAVENLRGGRR